MKCPIQPFISRGTDLGILAAGDQCLLQECAWWDEELEDCGLFAITLQLASIAEVLSTIAKELTLLRPVSRERR